MLSLSCHRLALISVLAVILGGRGSCSPLQGASRLTGLFSPLHPVRHPHCPPPGLEVVHVFSLSTRSLQSAQQDLRPRVRPHLQPHGKHGRVCLRKRFSQEYAQHLQFRGPV